MAYIEKKSLDYLRGLKIALFIFVVAFILEKYSFFKEGCVIGFAEPIVEWAMAFFFYKNFLHKASFKSHYPAICFFFFLVFLGIGDFFYALFYYALGYSSKTLIVTFLTTNLYVVAYVLGSCSMILYSNSSILGWFKDYRNWIPYLITLPLALRLMYTPFWNAYTGSGFNYYVLIEILGVLTTLILISTAMRVLVNTRSSFWEWISTGLVSLVLCDWALRVEKLVFGEPKFGFYEYLYFISVLICSVPILFVPRKPKRIEDSGVKSLSSSYKLYTLFAVFISLLFLTLSQYGDRDAIRLASIGCIVGCFVSVYISKFMVKEIQGFSDSITSIAGLLLEGRSSEFNKHRQSLPVELIETVDLVVQKQIADEKERAQLKQNLALQEARVEIANQVAHDIRSPLSALDVALHGIKDFPEERRVLARSAITRIKDIANNLLSKNMIASSKLFSHLLTPILESILSEKRYQFRHYLNVSIEFQLSKETYGIFSVVNLSDMKRVISNIIDNSIESFENKVGVVKVSLYKKDERVLIEIVDNGKGIPSEYLPEIGIKGKSFGKEFKESGSGLGLYFAKNTLQSWGGDLQIESKLGCGTRVIVSLPQVIPPAWFVPEIVVTKNTSIVVVDDDLSIHQVWESRFQLEKKIFHFSSINEFEVWISGQKTLKDFIFLVDFEFSEEKNSGLDIILKYNILENSILVSSRLEEDRVQETISSQSVRALPKSLANYIPIRFLH